MNYKSIEDAENAIKNIRRNIKNINAQITEYYKDNPRNRDRDWLSRAMYAKNGKRLRIKKIESWIENKKNSETLFPNESVERIDFIDNIVGGSW
jgi:hypothetical protein